MRHLGVMSALSKDRRTTLHRFVIRCTVQSHVLTLVRVLEPWTDVTTSLPVRVRIVRASFSIHRHGI